MRKEPSIPIGCTPERILVIRAGAIGDLILTLPVLRALRKRFPGAYLEVMGHPHTLALIEGQRVLDAVSSIDQREVAQLCLPDAPITEKLRRTFGAFDLIVAYTADVKGPLIINLQRTGTCRVIAWPPFPTKRIHEADHLLDALQSLGITSSDHAPGLFPTSLDRVFAAQFFDTHSLCSSRPVLALHPGSGSASKCWPADHFARIADWAIQSLSAAVLLITGPADEKAGIQMLQGMRERPLRVSDSTLPQLAALLQRCSAFIGNDSGITHLAAAVGAPTGALFGPTDPRIWGPRGKTVRVLHHEMDCSPCDTLNRKRCPHRTCMEAIGVQEVAELVLALLDTTD
ncbi:MAG: glycosyltransferase family 9 protein [Candidatus Latescibacterota bacterium]